MGPMVDAGEILAIERFVPPAGVVLDAGAHEGAWAAEVLSRRPRVTAHLFEPLPGPYRGLLRRFAREAGEGRVVPHNMALAEAEGCRPFWHYQDAESWSTFHRRPEVERENHLRPPRAVNVPVTTVDAYRARQGLARVDFLKIDVEGGERDVLRGARESLARGCVDHVQFEYGGTYRDAGTTLREVFDFLAALGYLIFRLTPDGPRHLPAFTAEMEDYGYANFLAANERFRVPLLGLPWGMLDLSEQCRRHGVTPRGVVHVGAHEGGEMEKYRALGVSRVLFIEANPAVHERLVANVGKEPGVVTANVAISGADGEALLRVTSMDQSSSLLPLKGHAAIYPDIVETSQVRVKTRRLDTLLAELGLRAEDYNLLNIDIQGAELMALRGAERFLRHVDGINTEVNFEELYEGCALIEDLDAFLEERGFHRAATTTPYHPTWGDAWYARRRAIAMSTLGANGGLGNSFFQYAFLHVWAKERGLRVETSPWNGQRWFGRADPPPARAYPELVDLSHRADDSALLTGAAPAGDTDLVAYGQYHTRFHAPHRETIRALFTPASPARERLSFALANLRARGGTVVGVHMRRRDYDYSYFFAAPGEWYRRWLDGFWATLDRPVLFLASDLPDLAAAELAPYRPVTSRDLGADLADLGELPDFFLLAQCDALAISNSSFSFAAAMLNERARWFARPSLPAKSLVPFDPWNSEPLLRNAEVETIAPDGDDPAGSRRRLAIYAPDDAGLKGERAPILFPFRGVGPHPAGRMHAGPFGLHTWLSGSYYRLAPSLEQADLVVHPVCWPAAPALAADLARRAAKHGKMFVLFCDEQHGGDAPFPGALVLRPLLRRAARRPGEFALPAWVEDPLAGRADTRLPMRPWSARPVVAPPPGEGDAAALFEADYVRLPADARFPRALAMTLAAGRVPILANDEFILPFEGVLDWPRYSLRADARHAAARAAAFHANLTPERWEALQTGCRRVWEGWLAPFGFFGKLYRYVAAARAAVI
ncbi:MAG: FkbM family methyltransferase [Planctomycetes bacterium]|nr:FkbM family methyltransferase [Planctomycetota bacterium]